MAIARIHLRGAVRASRQILMRGACALAVVLAIGAPWTAAGQDQQSGVRTVWDGVYTTVQAERGKAAYLDKCAACHKNDLSGYQGALKGDQFMRHWGEDNLENFFTTMRSTMPRGAAASLSDEVYLNILTFILQANDFPSGPRELAAGALRSVQVQPKSGPVEVPAGALVDLVGCLAPGPGGGWMLTRASKPVRTRNPSNATAEWMRLRLVIFCSSAIRKRVDWSRFSPV